MIKEIAFKHRKFCKNWIKNEFSTDSNFLICQFLYMWDLKIVNLKWKQMWQKKALIFKFIQKKLYIFEKRVLH
jgi:hypothetical protein